MEAPRPRVVIVGGGFGGIAAARALRSAAVDVLLLDRHNHYVFQPLLYQVATGALAPSEIVVPIRWYLRRQKNTTVLLATVTRVDAVRRCVQLEDGSRETYDYLIVAAGARHSYFGRGEWEVHAPGLKELEDALVMRERFLLAFERAERAASEAEKAALLTFVIVGGGPTGVELAGVMMEIGRRALRDDFRRIDTATTRVVLVEAGPRLLPALPESLSRQAKADLEDMGVEVLTTARVTEVAADHVIVAGQRLDTRTVFWAAGNEASPLSASLGPNIDRAGRVRVQPDLSIEGHPEVFVIGDLAAVTRADGSLVPGVGPAAMQMGRCAASNIRADLERRARKVFRYVNKGDLATIGRMRAVADFGSFTVTGAPAWFLWLFVHILYLASFRNRVIVLVQWAYSYFTWERGARLIRGKGIGNRE